MGEASNCLSLFGYQLDDDNMKKQTKKSGIPVGHAGQRAIAKFFGVSLQTIRNWRHHRGMPSTTCKSPGDNAYSSRIVVIFEWKATLDWAQKARVNPKRGSAYAKKIAQTA